jgi:hypothetical protein
VTDDIAAGAIAAHEIAEVNGTDVSGVAAEAVAPDCGPHPLASWVNERLAMFGMSVEEAAAWCGIALVATLSRVVNLGSPPLNVEESRRALEAWTLLNDGRVAYEGGPILTNLTSIAFILFTDGDLQARLVPALAGVLLVLSPLLLRPIAGGWWAVLASIALAASTTLLSASRSVSPAIPMLLCLMVTAIGAWRFGLTYERRWLITTVVAALVGVGVDTSFVVGLVGLILAYAIAEGEIFGKVSWLGPVAANWRRALVIGVVVAILLDTRLLTTPGGIQAGLFDPLTRWTTEISRGAGLTAPILLGLLDGAIVLLALIGLVEYPRRSRAIRFLGTWLVVSLTLASLMRMPEVRYLALPLLPASLLAGFGLYRLCAWIVEAGSVRTTVLGLVAIVPVITTSFQINAGLRQNLSPWGASGVVLVAGLLLAGLLAFNLLRGLQLGAAFATWLLVILAVGSIAGAGRALEARGDDRGQLIEQTVITPEMAFIREIALKWYRASPEGPLPVDPGLRPLVGWALRDIPTVRYDPSANAAPVARLLADPPSQVGPDTITIRPVVGYAADWPSLALQPPRIWRWLSNRETLVTLRPYAIVVVQPAGS